MPTNQPSGEPAWNGPPRTPPPVGQRIVIGICWPGAPVRLGGDGDDRVEGAGDEVGELELDDRTLAHPGGADRGADEALLGDRRVDHALRAELLEQARRDAEGAAEDADVLAEQEDAVVLAHRVLERGPDRLEIRDLADGCRLGRPARRFEVADARHGGETIGHGSVGPAGCLWPIVAT